MAIKVKTVKKAQPGIKGGGDFKYYVTVASNGRSNIVDIAKVIKEDTKYDEDVIKKVLYSLIDNVPEILAKGNLVKIGDLGSLRLSLKSDGLKNPDHLNESHIKKVKITFSPGSKLKGLLKAVQFRF